MFDVFASQECVYMDMDMGLDVYKYKLCLCTLRTGRRRKKKQPNRATVSLVKMRKNAWTLQTEWGIKPSKANVHTSHHRTCIKREEIE